MRDTGLKSPTATGDDWDQFNNADRAFVSNDSRTGPVGNGDPDYQDYYDFGINIPTGSNILGIEVLIEGFDDEQDISFQAALSHDGGATYTANKNDSFNSLTDVIKTYGSPTELWGRVWSAEEFSNTNFRVRIGQTVFGDGTPIDHVQVRITYVLPDTEYINPGTVVDDDTIGSVAWSNPSNAKSSDDSYASALIGTFANGAKENEIKLVKAGVISGNNKSTGANIPGTEATIAYGEDNDLWGLELTPADINDENFGVVFSVTNNIASISHYLWADNFGFTIPSNETIGSIKVNVGRRVINSGGFALVQVDNVQIKVSYTATVTKNDQTPTSAAAGASPRALIGNKVRND